MKYLTKTQFKEIVGRLEKLRGYSPMESRLELWSEGIFNFIDMEPGIIYIRVMNEWEPILYMTLIDSSINREWVGIYNSTTITKLNALRKCEIYSTTLPEPIYQSKTPTIGSEKVSVTYWWAGGLVLNGYGYKTVKIYTYGSISPQFMNWADNPFEV
jgi:hypothetical protein